MSAGQEGINWICMSQDTKRFLRLVDVAVNVLLLYHRGNILTDPGKINFSRLCPWNLLVS